MAQKPICKISERFLKFKSQKAVPSVTLLQVVEITHWRQKVDSQVQGRAMGYMLLWGKRVSISQYYLHTHTHTHIAEAAPGQACAMVTLSNTISQPASWAEEHHGHSSGKILRSALLP